MLDLKNPNSYIKNKILAKTPNNYINLKSYSMDKLVVRGTLSFTLFGLGALSALKMLNKQYGGMPDENG